MVTSLLHLNEAQVVQTCCHQYSWQFLKHSTSSCSALGNSTDVLFARRDTSILRSVDALGPSAEVWIAAVMRFSVPPYFHSERKETDARAGGDCYTFKSPGLVFSAWRQITFPFCFFFYCWIF